MNAVDDAQTGIDRASDRHFPAKPARVLVADDEHLVATDLAFTLGELGYTVVGPVTDGEAAVQLARRAKPDLALLDIRMPKRDGLSAAAELFEDMAIPVIILSAYSDTKSVEAAAGAGVFGYLVKPAAEEQLRVCIEVAWSRFLHLASQRLESGKLRQRLDERKAIEQAKWLLVSKRNMPEPDAMKLLHKKARDSRQTLLSVAEAVIRGEEIGG